MVTGQNISVKISPVHYMYYIYNIPKLCTMTYKKINEIFTFYYSLKYKKSRL